MTRYDPFSFGQVQLDHKASDAGSQPLAPDDLLFADGGQQKQAPPADDDWAAAPDHSMFTASGRRDGTVEQFGTDILGENVVASTSPRRAEVPALKANRPKPATVSRQPSASPRGEVASPNEERAMRPSPLQPTAGNGTTRPAPSAPRPARSGAVDVDLAPRSAGALGVLAPGLILVLGGIAASWFWLLRHNPVMGAIVGLSALVGAMLAYLMMKR